MSIMPTPRFSHWQALWTWLAVVFLVITGSNAHAQETLGDDNQGGANLSVRGDEGVSSNVEILEAADDAAIKTFRVELAQDLYQEQDLMLQGLSAIENIWFTIPSSWELVDEPEIHTEFSHSAALLEYRSSLTVLVNEQAVGSVNLGADNVEGTELVSRIPLQLLQATSATGGPARYNDHNQLTFVVNQHYTDDCEDPFDPSLWTRVSRRSYIEFHYRDRQLDPDLSEFPYPIWDPLGYGPLRLTLVQPAAPSPASQDAAGRIAFAFGRLAGWRRVIIEEPVEQVGEATTAALMVGLIEEHPQISHLVNVSDIGDNGLVAVVPHPRDPSIPIMVVTGRTPEALTIATNAAVGHARKEILAGRRSVLSTVDTPLPPPTEQRPLPAYDLRKFDLQEIKFSDTTVRGFYAPEIRIPLRLQGDAVVRPGGGTAKVTYSYSAGLDVRLSTMEVRLNGVPLRSVRLDQMRGEQEAQLTVNLPYEIIEPHSNLDVVFHLFPNDFGPCQRVSDRHLWGTVFERTSITLPRDHYVDMPDLSKLRYGAFPYDFEDGRSVAIVLPDAPTNVDLSAAMQIASDLGRLTIAEDPQLLVTQSGQEAPQNQHILLVRETPHSSYDALQGELVTSGDLERSLKDEGQDLLKTRNSAPLSTVEQVLLSDRESTRLVVRAPNSDQLLELSARLLDGHWVQGLTGNLAVVSDGGEVRPVAVGDKERMGQMSIWSSLRLAFQENLWLFGLLAIVLFIFAAILIRTWAAMRGGSTE